MHKMESFIESMHLGELGHFMHKVKDFIFLCHSLMFYEIIENDCGLYLFLNISWIIFEISFDEIKSFTKRFVMFRNQLQLLGAVCLLVSWKVRAHSPITAQRLVEYTDYNVTVDNILVSPLDLLEYELK